nr:pyridoxamine 5'-phosphate oxidase [Streptomyces zhaozhouensis]
MSENPNTPRTGAQRRRDLQTRMEQEPDCWVATAGTEASDGGAAPCMVPLSFLWWDGTVLCNTRRTNPTARNVAANGRAVISLGDTRDVVLMETTGELLPDEALPPAVSEAFVTKSGWDPRGRAPWRFLRFRPHRIRAWHEEHEIEGWELMRDGRWLV